MLKCKCHPATPLIVNTENIYSTTFLFCLKCESIARDEGPELGGDRMTELLTATARQAYEREASDFKEEGLPWPYSGLNDVAREREKFLESFRAFLEVQLPLGLVPDWRGWTVNLPLTLWPQGLALWLKVSQLLMMRASLEP